MMTTPANREEISHVTGLDEAPSPINGADDGPPRQPSVMGAQAAALRAQFHGASLVVTLAIQGLEAGTIGPDDREMLLLVLRTLVVQFDAGMAQCDSFLTMAEAMSAMLPGARPQPPSPTMPKVFGGGVAKP